jgi:hypothetical protein
VPWTTGLKMENAGHYEQSTWAITVDTDEIMKVTQVLSTHFTATGALMAIA